MARTPKESIIDKLLLLYIIDRTNEKGRMDGNTKLQKLVFLSEHELVNQKKKGFNYRFIRFTYGPFSNEVLTDFRKLLEVELLIEGKKGLYLTENGKELLKLCEEIFHDNKQITEAINEIIDKFANQSLKQILEFVYSMYYPRYKKTMKELSQKQPILFKMKESNADVIFEVDNECLESLDILFEPKSYNALKESMKAAREKPLLTFKDMFG